MNGFYGVGYEPIGDLADFFDPFGIRKVPEKVKAKVDNYVESKSRRAASLVEKGVRHAVDDAKSQALLIGGLVVGASALAGGVYYFTHKKGGGR